MKRNKIYSGVVSSLFVAAIVVGTMFDTAVARSRNQSQNESFYEWSTVFERVLQRVRFGYVEEVNDSLFVRKAIEGGLSILDAHTTFFDPKDYENLMVQTEGQFGGLGIQISIRDNILTIMTPIGGTPAERAGLRSGDRIMRIDGVSTRGRSTDWAVSRMRGEPGTIVTLTIQREGEEPIDYTIERAIINIRSVPHAGLLNDSIGYVRLNTFSQTAASEVARKVDSLRNEGMRALIFDLRSNPGGLLTQAGEISELFLPKGSLVVFTRGRHERDTQRFFTRRQPHIPADMPLVVLVNRASASASEIVAGAIQDLDRGVILGDTTFGKGSVQSVFPIDETRHMKMTTAFYFTPSGRGINRPDNSRRGADEEDDVFGDSENDENLAERDTTPADTTVYFTRNGRRVFGGGGIIPDTIVRNPRLPYIVQNLQVRDAFFRFANFYYPILERQNIAVDTNFVITDKILGDFFAFLDSVNQNYETFAERKFREFKVYLGLAADTTIDTAQLNYLRLSLNEKDSLRVLELTAELNKIMENNRQALLKSQKTLLERQLRSAFLVRAFGQDNDFVQRFRLQNDQQLESAIKILKNRGVYDALLSGGNANTNRREERRRR